MKKLLILLALILCVTFTNAAPVDVDLAEQAGRQFVAASFATCPKTAALQLVYTGTTDRGEACFYVFNVDEAGFVIISADDRFRPVVGYSDEGIFPSENRSPEMMFYLGKIIEARQSTDAVFPTDARQEWNTLLEQGKTLSRNGGKEATYLCETKWNQNSPYNYYSPEASSGPGGRCYAGCVATAMSQVMKYWDSPAQGTGTHSYYSSYGHLSANFGATTYDWEHMPNHITSSNSTQEEIEAVALLMYHCAIAVDMAFSPNGSAAYSEDVTTAIRKYFSYSNRAKQEYRDYFTLEDWQNLLKEQFDLGWPVYYGGYSDSGGHAFVCDGYDDNDLFHFNWGWGGSSDGWFVIDEIDYANWSSAITSYVPAEVYNYMPLGPSDFTSVSQGDSDFTATLQWINPTHNIHGAVLDAIDKIVVCRNGEVISEFNNPVPGEAMSYTDHFLPVKVSYSAYAVCHGVSSAFVAAEDVALGPTCPWTIEMTSTDADGWQGGAVLVKDGKGVEFAQLTTNSASKTMSFEMPVGHLTFAWKNPQVALEHFGFVIRDVTGKALASFEGASADLQEGVFYLAENACGTEKNEFRPFHLTGAMVNQEVQLQWEINSGFNNIFFLYRDGLLYDVTHENYYTDVNAEGLFHTYFVTSFDGAIESAPSNTCNVQAESEYASPSNLRYEINAQGKLQLTWDPAGEGETGYLVFRRAKGEAFKRIKATTSTTYADNIKILPNDFYEYAVAACYSTIDNASSYANAQGDLEQYYVSFNKTVIPVGLEYEIVAQGVSLSWSDAMVAEEYSLFRDGVLLADHLTAHEFLDQSAETDQVYCYAVAGKTAVLTEEPIGDVCTNDSNDIEESDPDETVSLYPNPASDCVTVTAKGLRKVTVFNLLGQEILSIETSGDYPVIDLKSLSQGSYVVRLQGEHGCFVVKLMKQ